MKDLVGGVGVFSQYKVTARLVESIEFIVPSLSH
jgi:hypothetical protein